MTTEIIFAGFGGQGVILAGKILTLAGMSEDKFVSHIPSYGAEMRGGTANCSVIVSDEEVASPVMDEPAPSAPAVEPQVQAVNSMDMGVNQAPNIEINTSSAPVMPSMPVEPSPNVNVMPNPMPQVEPSVNPQMVNLMPNQNMNVEPTIPNVPNIE